MTGAQMDARVWAKLQDHIPLQCIHEKMPYKDFFALGVVCKSWKQATLERVEPKPYFVSITFGASEEYQRIQYLHGILTYDVGAGKSSWRRQDFVLDGDPPLEVEGLIYCIHPDDPDVHTVFNIHSRTWHIIPPPPEISHSKSALGMTVDTSKRPYSFKLFLGCIDRKTQIYDSWAGSWSSRSSYLEKSPTTSRFASCICINGCVYLSQEHQEIILMYSIERDYWTTLRGPPLREGHVSNDDALGTWEGRIFTTRENLKQSCMVVWELVSQTKNEWVEYARISGTNYEWLIKRELDYHGPALSDEVDYTVVTRFCSQYLLICHWQFDIAREYGLLLFNLATKECKILELPEGIAVAMTDQETEDEEDGFVCRDSEAEESASEGPE